MALFGLTPSKPETPKSAQTDTIFDVTAAEFESRVLQASMQKPVLVDFWAPWCGPCKQLMPVLEAEVNAAGGNVILAKVNIDDHPELAQALRIQSVPTVMAFFQGQPVSGFAGARPASDIKNLIAQLVKLARNAMPDAIDIPLALKDAAAFLSAGDAESAQDLYLRVLQQDENNVDAFTGLVRAIIEAGRVEEAEIMISQAPESIAKHPAFNAAKTSLELAKGAGEASRKLKPLIKRVQESPEDNQARYDLACAQFSSGDRAGAISNMLEIIRLDRTWNDDAARKELLRFFEALGFSDPLAVDGRKKLSRLLFS